MDMPVNIILGGVKLLTLAKGQYTLLPLAPGTFEMEVNSFTVNESCAMTPVSSELTPVGLAIDEPILQR
jgi:hypothetical protein